MFKTWFPLPTFEHRPAWRHFMVFKSIDHSVIFIICALKENSHEPIRAREF